MMLVYCSEAEGNNNPTTTNEVEGLDDDTSTSDTTLSINTPKNLCDDIPLDLTVFPILEENTDNEGDDEFELP